MYLTSFMLANYASRATNYQAEQRWGEKEAETSAYFQPIETFGERFENYIQDVAAAGFQAVDLWQPMLDQRWLTDIHLDKVADLLHKYGLTAVSFAGWLGSTVEEFERNCEIAAALGIPVLGGDTLVQQRGFVVQALKKYGLKWGYENEAERMPEAVLENIGGDPDNIGICADVGWFGTHGYDAAEALRLLAPRLFHVHLKDVLRAGEHETCRFGRGIVPLERCVRVLGETGYQGAITIEHETGQGDPTEDCRASLRLLRDWLNAD